VSLSDELQSGGLSSTAPTEHEPRTGV
jgi:hypothetical protein